MCAFTSTILHIYIYIYNIYVCVYACVLGLGVCVCVAVFVHVCACVTLCVARARVCCVYHSHGGNLCGPSNTRDISSKIHRSGNQWKTGIWKLQPHSANDNIFDPFYPVRSVQQNE